MRRTIKGTAVGNFMEWYDFGVYGYIATTLARVFYPGNSASAGSLLATFGTLTAAFAVRPVGGFIFGPLGDRIGRKKVLVATILLMTLGTTATGVLPGYHRIGVWAPILLIVTRIFQGFSTGGEYVGTMTYVNEHAPDRRRGMMASFLPLSSQAGYVVAGALVTGLHTWLTDDQMLSWGWRLPLLLSAPLGVIAVYLRLQLEESPAYQDANGDQDTSGDDGGQQFRRTIIEQWKPLLICIGLVLTYNVTDYMLTGYLPTYLKAIVRIGHTAGLAMIVLTLLVVMSAVVFVARLSDRIGVKPVLWTGCGLLLAGSVPALLLIRSGGGYPVVFAGVLLIGVMLLCFDSTLPATLPALFPTTVRYGALAVGFNISVSAFGGTTPLIAEALISGTGNLMVPAYLLMAAGLIGMVALRFTPEVAGKRLPGSAPSVENERQARDLAQGRPVG
ncbi:MFS transporter [Mycobacterium eburneum]|nr:MFS transporter [Mycobacterium eburneum]TDH49793.1 MFS transporter [Mycobacterium eburneum]